MNMNIKSLLGLLVILIILLGGLYWVYGKDRLTSPAQNGSTAIESPTNSGMRVEENAIVVTEQKPGSIATASLVFLATPGFVVIHEDSNGAPGAVLGSSAILQLGENSDVKINLSRVTRDGEKLHAMLHADTDRNGAFSSVDQPVQSRLGGPISGWFEVSADAQENSPITI